MVLDALRPIVRLEVLNNVDVELEDRPYWHRFVSKAILFLVSPAMLRVRSSPARQLGRLCPLSRDC